MSFISVRLASFRNLADATVDVSAERIFLVGENGQGKTNFLEALYYLSYGSSFRGSADNDVLKHGFSGFSLSCHCTSLDVGDALPPEELSIVWEARRKDIRHNGKSIRDRKELIDLNPSIVFCHEDFSFAAGEPERRRFFFDQTSGLISPGYIDVLRDYKKILRHRNVALKEGRVSLLEAFDIQLAGKGLTLVEERSRLQQDFDSRFASRYEAVSLLGREVRLRYKPSWTSALGIDGVIALLEKRRPEELALGTSLSGPHRDRWTFISEGADFASTASTGQIRLLSLTLRMVQADYYTEMTGRLPVLLLDDVLLELDREKRKRFLELLPKAGQSIFTFLPGEPWEDYKTRTTLCYEVVDGRFKN
jgi:DNA replication and repair protein RecF